MQLAYPNHLRDRYIPSTETSDFGAVAVRHEIAPEALPMSTIPSPLLTSEHVAEWLGITVGALELRRKRKQSPPFIRLGRTIRYQSDQVSAWIAAQRENAPAGSE